MKGVVPEGSTQAETRKDAWVSSGQTGEGSEKQARPKSDGVIFYINRLSFSLLDTFSDNTRVRALNIFAFALVYVFVVLGLMQIAAETGKHFAEIDIVSPPPQSLVAGNIDLPSMYGLSVAFQQSLEERGVSLKPKSMKARLLYNDGSAIQGAEISPAVVEHVSSGQLPCSTRDRERIAGTLEATMSEDACRVTLSGGGKTDTFGVGRVQGLQIDGPVGQYTLKAYHGGRFSGVPYTTSTKTIVNDLKVVSASQPFKAGGEPNSLEAPASAQSGYPFVEQPAVLVQDASGDPVQGIHVVAFPYADPVWPAKTEEVPPYFRRGQKFAGLSCSRSEASNAQGIARFTCLGVEYSSFPYVNIVFTVANIVFTPWNDITYSPGSAISYSPLWFRPSIFLDTQVSKVRVLQHPPSEVHESAEITEIQLSLKTSADVPVVGRRCLALVKSLQGFEYVSLFRQTLQGQRRKELLNAISDPSDAAGNVVFRGLTISGYGNTRTEYILTGDVDDNKNQSLTIAYYCDGVESDVSSNIVSIRSKVNTVQIKRFLDKEAFVEPGFFSSPDKEDLFVAVVRVIDQLGAGVAGKTVNVKTDDVYAELSEEDMEPTGPSGFAVVAFRVKIGTYELRQAFASTFKVQFEVDGVLSDQSEELTMRLREYVPQRCHGFIYGNVWFRNATGHWVETDVSSTGVPRIRSGELFMVKLSFFGSDFDTRITGSGGEAGITSSGESNVTRMLAQRQDLLERLAAHEDAETLDQLPRSRRLQSGAATLEAVQYYSTDGDINYNSAYSALYKVANLPSDLTKAAFLTNFTELSEQLDATPGEAWVIMQVLGARGRHVLRLRMQRDSNECFSPPLYFDLQSPVKSIQTSTTYIEVEHMEPFTFDFMFQGEDPTQPPVDRWLADSNEFLDGAVILQFVQVPPILQSTNLELRDVPAPLISALYTFQQIGDASTGTLKLQGEFKQGVFGTFVFVLESSGIRSTVVAVTIKKPPMLSLTMIQEPAAPNSTALSGSYLSNHKMPQVLVTSESQPQAGVRLYAEPQTISGTFAKLTDLPMFDLMQMLVSLPSDTNGMAFFPSFGVFSAAGCFRFRIYADSAQETSLDPSPQEPICISSNVKFTIMSSPPKTLPLGQRLSDMTGASFQVRAFFPSGLPDILANNIYGIRIAVYPEDGNYDTAVSNTRRLLSNTVCLWVHGVDILHNCGSPEVPSDPAAMAAVPFTTTFTVHGLKWERADDISQKIKLVITDLAMTQLLDLTTQIQLPETFQTYNSIQKASFCYDALKSAAAPISTSSLIAPELTAASAVMVVAPPSQVEVGATFLVRIQLRTMSGGPVRHKKIRVALAPASLAAPTTVGAGILERFARAGNKLKAFFAEGVSLDLQNVLRESNIHGLVSFPLSILEAASGQYQLRFQGEDPLDGVLLTSAPFSVMNPIYRVESDGEGWGDLEVEKAGESITIPRQLRFKIAISGGRSLHELSDAGFNIRIMLRLRGVSDKVVKQKEKQAKLIKAGMNVAKHQVKSNIPNLNAVKKLADSGIASAKNLVGSVLSKHTERLSAEVLHACGGTELQGILRAANETEEREVSAADAVAENQDVLDPNELMSQFVDLVAGGGTLMIPKAEMTLKKKVNLSIDDVRLISASTTSENQFVGIYEVTKKISFSFQHDARYAWSIESNGVKSAEGAFPTFTCVKPPPTPTETAVDWLVTFGMLAVGCLVLTTNTLTHHWFWFLIGIIGVIVGMTQAHSLNPRSNAMGGHWPTVAVVVLALNLVCLLWGLFIELYPLAVPKLKANDKLSITFGEKRKRIFRSYTRRRLLNFICHYTAEPNPWQATLIQQFRQILRPFNDRTAFYFSSDLLSAIFLALASYVYVFLLTLKYKAAIKRALEGVLNNTIGAALRLVSAMESTFNQATAQDLPDDAVSFVYKQLNVVQDWFQGLIDCISVSMTVGIIVGAICTCAAIIATCLDFRRRVIMARAGKYTYKPKNALFVSDCSFIGSFITSTLVGFIMIVFLAVLCGLPFGWPVLWKMIWGMRDWIIGFALPLLVKPIVTLIAKKFIFENHAIRFRWIATFFYFFQTQLAIAAGVMGSMVRTVLALLTTILFLPQVFLPVTSEAMGKMVLLDGPHKIYLAGVHVHHCFNHPIMVTASEALLSLLKERRDALESGMSPEERNQKARKRSKRFVILLLMTHPWLRNSRKAFLAKKKEQEKERKAQASKEAANAASSKAKLSPCQVKLCTAIANADAEAQRLLRYVAELKETQHKLAGLSDKGGTEAERLVAEVISSQKA